MKKLHNRSPSNTEITRLNSNKMFPDELKVHNPTRQAQQARESRGDIQSLRHQNEIMRGKNYDVNSSSYDYDASQIAYFINSLSNKQKEIKSKKSKSKVITIIDHDIDENINDTNPQNDVKSSIKSQRFDMQKNDFELVKLPLIMNKNNHLSKNKINRKKQFLSYIYSHINSSRNFQNHRQQDQQHINSNKSLNFNQDLTLGFDQKTTSSRKRQNYQGLLFPNLNRHRTISLPQSQAQFKSKKNQIKLSGVTVIPSQRINQQQKSYFMESKSQKTPQINLISSQMIHNNSISNVKKSVYQLLVRKVQSTS